LCRARPSDIARGLSGGGALVEMHPFQPLAADNLVGAVAENALESGVDHQQAAIGGHHAHRVREQLQDLARGWQFEMHGTSKGWSQEWWERGTGCHGGTPL